MDKEYNGKRSKIKARKWKGRQRKKRTIWCWFFLQLKCHKKYTLPQRKRQRENDIESLCTKRFPYIMWTWPMRLVRNGSGFGHLISGILNIFICTHFCEKFERRKASPFSTYSCENWLALYWSRTHHNEIWSKLSDRIHFEKMPIFSTVSYYTQYNTMKWTYSIFQLLFFYGAIEAFCLLSLSKNHKTHSFVQTDTHTFTYGKLIFIQQYRPNKKNDSHSPFTHSCVQFFI